MIVEKININSSDKEIIQYLGKLGKLSNDFDGDIFLPFLNHKNPKIRLLAIKNLGKLKNIKYLNTAKNIWKKDENSIVRKEAVSTIGRMKVEDIIPTLIEVLEDDDPEVVLQGIRGLLTFKKRNDVKKALKKITNHPNEIIQQIIRVETTPIKKYEYDAINSPDYLKNIVVNADVLDTLKLVPDESIHLTFTSPPYYNAKDYSRSL